MLALLQRRLRCLSPRDVRVNRLFNSPIGQQPPHFQLLRERVDEPREDHVHAVHLAFQKHLLQRTWKWRAPRRTSGVSL